MHEMKGVMGYGLPFGKGEGSSPIICPEGTSENSPPIHRWDPDPPLSFVPEGRSRLYLSYSFTTFHTEGEYVKEYHENFHQNHLMLYASGIEGVIKNVKKTYIHTFCSHFPTLPYLPGKTWKNLFNL